MKKIAFITPWPPQNTGIADHIYSLVKDLKKDLHIEVITDAKNPLPLEGVIIKDFKSANFQEYDKLIYEIGNNFDFHHNAFEILKHYGGIVHLHDLVLHHFLAPYLISQGGIEHYIQTLAKWYGHNVSSRVKELTYTHGINLWEKEEVVLLPLYEELLQYADSCIVHSHFIKKKINKIFPDMPVKVLWLFPFGEEFQEPIKNDNYFDIGIFGGVQQNRKIDIVLKVVEKLLKEKFPIRLHIVGSIDVSQKYLQERYNEYEEIRFYGRVDEEEFKQKLKMMDICINLRFPTMGETSGVVIRALEYGIPTIVSNIGWYKELPDFITKIDVQETQNELYTRVKEKLNKVELIKEKKQIKCFLQEEFNLKNISDSYKDTLSSLKKDDETIQLSKLDSILKELDIKGI